MNTGVVVRSRGDQDTLTRQAVRDKRADDDLDEAVETFVRVQPRLMAIGYRFLGDKAEAEDVVQETWVRWQKLDRTVVADPPALMATMAARLAINLSQSAWRRREASVSPTGADAATSADDPATTAEQHEAVEQAIRIIMASLSPRERAAFVLREVFGYPYDQISEFLHLNAVNTRQLVCRARRRIGADRHGIVGPTAYPRFLEAFLNAAEAGDLTGLEELLAADLTGGTNPAPTPAAGAPPPA